MPKGRKQVVSESERKERAVRASEKWHQAKRKENRANGICKCGRPRKDGSTQCQHCWAYAKEYNFNYRFDLRLQALEAYGNACKCCGETTPEFLQFDHVANDGHIHRKSNTARSGIALWLKQNKYPDTIQLLCGNCHAAKSFYGYCPHKPIV